ncbi:MAG: hypothetical protein HC849_34435 [Oscillatoriales cyanobacterium RU_3_3]|nr:hypothetical protein [Oscillatoriales cyanobacterium RU_3_3]
MFNDLRTPIEKTRLTIAQTAASYYRSLDFDELDRGCGSMSSIALALQLRSDRFL